MAIKDEYSIEYRSKKIFDRRTKEYFEEVISSYQHGNMRSATVMLWSIAICDIIFKLQNLYETSADSVSKDILNEIEKYQNDKPRSSEWESKLIELVEERTRLLDQVELDNLRHLQRQRHLSAHPVLSKGSNLHQPNKETVRAFIRNTLDGLLTKPPIYTQRVFDAFIQDLADSEKVLVSDDRLRSYIESKYLLKADKQIENSLIRSLWKLVFRLTNEDCEDHRSINYRALRILIERNNKIIDDIVSGESDYFSNIAQEGSPILLLVHLLSDYPSLYECLNQSAKVIIKYVAETDKEARILAWFLHETIYEHGKSLLNWITSEERPKLYANLLNLLWELSDSEEWEKMLFNIFNAYYGESCSYDEADERFSLVIEPHIKKYHTDDIYDLLENIESNSQVNDRRRARFDHNIIKKRCDQLDVDYSRYQNFARSVRD